MGARKKSYKERRERIKVSKRERRRERGPIPKNFHLKKSNAPNSANFTAGGQIR